METAAQTTNASEKLKSMDAECIPLSEVPGTTPLFRDYAMPRAAATGSAAGSRFAETIERWYPADPFGMQWANAAPELSEKHREQLSDLLLAEQRKFGAGEAAVANSAAAANIAKLRGGAAAVVTGQQVGLFGGPLLTLLKAATAVRKAQDATKLTGRDHVPVFWLATEDHDIDEVDQVTLLTKTAAEMRSAGLRVGSLPVPVGEIAVGERVGPVLSWAEEMLAFAPITRTLRDAYTDDDGSHATLATGIGKLLAKIFTAQGLIVMDASSREFHALGAPVLRYAIEHASELEAPLLARSRELESAGYHAQVLVAAGHSLLFLITTNARGVRERVPLRRAVDDAGATIWRAGQQSFTTDELLKILDIEPERLSPNALLRAVFQDCILPTAAYIGGPAEIAYFAQSAVVYQAALGRVTPVLPRLSATLIEPAIAKTMAAHEVSVAQVWAAKTAAALTLRLGARAMPIEGKRKVAAVGNTMEAELVALSEYMTAMSADLGRAAGVSASKMRYQMSRLRRMAAAFEVQKEASLQKHATAIALSLFPDSHLQERLLAGVWFVARYGDGLAELLVEHAGQECPGHRVILL